MQGQLQAMLVLFSSEPSLHDALETALNELLEDAEALRIEKEALEQHVEEWSFNYREIHDGQEPMESEWYVYHVFSSLGLSTCPCCNSSHSNSVQF